MLRNTNEKISIGLGVLVLLGFGLGRTIEATPLALKHLNIDSKSEGIAHRTLVHRPLSPLNSALSYESDSVEDGWHPN